MGLFGTTILEHQNLCGCSKDGHSFAILAVKKLPMLREGVLKIHLCCLKCAFQDITFYDMSKDADGEMIKANKEIDEQLKDQGLKFDI